MTPESNTADNGKSAFERWLQPGRILVLVLIIALVGLIVVYLWRNIFISIHPGEAGVLYRLFTGTEVRKVYPQGLNIIAPWNTMHIYEVRKQLVSTSFDVLSARGLSVHLDVAVRYLPDREQLGILHQTIGPDYAERVVISQVQSVMRKSLSLFTAEEIYTNHDNLLNKAIVQAREEIGRNFVVAEDIIIRTLSLPEPVKQAIEDKLTQRELLESYVFRLQTANREAERKRDEAKGIRDYQREVNMTLSEQVLEYNGIQATKKLAQSKNAKVIIIGRGKRGLPLVSGETSTD